ncbi:MAG: L-threonylcarbamoyladenylate synthase [Thermoanaerobaculia bacterium]|nr:L-threonylcarbamoyladenylate synthase [Thermoanaerobaculia bacterium]
MNGAPPVWRWGDPVEPLARLFARGGVAAIPTESSYGLAADPRSARGVAAVFAAKGRPAGKPLPVVAADLGQIRALGLVVDAEERAGWTALWPAPLTLLLPVTRPLPAAAGSGRCAVRVPAHRRLRGLLEALGHPLTATSANRSGEPPILEPARLTPLLIRSDAMIVDDGTLPGGPPSTLARLDPEGLTIVRPGALSREALTAARGGGVV